MNSNRTGDLYGNNLFLTKYGIFEFSAEVSEKTCSWFRKYQIPKFWRFQLFWVFVASSWKKNDFRSKISSISIQTAKLYSILCDRCGSGHFIVWFRWELKFNYFPWIELNWVNCCELKVSIQFVNIIVGNKIAAKHHKFSCFQIWLNLYDVKIVFATQKLKILNQKYHRKLRPQS